VTNNANLCLGLEIVASAVNLSRVGKESLNDIVAMTQAANYSDSSQKLDYLDNKE